MDTFNLEIAGLTAQIRPLFVSTKEYFRRYLSEKPAQTAISVSEADLVHEQTCLDREAEEEGLKKRRFTAPFLERAVIQRKMAQALLAYDTLLLHGSTVAVDGRAYLFAAACGTGKSTHTRLWREVFGTRAVMINDDKPFLRLMPEGVLACGSPWSGKHGLDTNVSLPLQGICILRRGEENTICSLPAEEAFPLLCHYACLPGETLDPQAEALVKTLAARMPLWQMNCNMQPQAATVAHEAMSAGQNRNVE